MKELNRWDEIVVWLRNALNFHERVAARYLRNRDWVVFYLEPEARECGDVCWLKLYLSEEAND